MKTQIDNTLSSKGRSLLLATVLAVAVSACCSRTVSVTTFAGNGTPGEANGVGTAATFNRPNDIAVDGKGNLYVADQQNDLIRKITPSRTVSLHFDWGARTGGGPEQITKLDANAKGELFVIDFEILGIKKVVGSVASTVTGFRRDDEYYDHYISVDGGPDSASFYFPVDLSLDLPAKNIKLIDRILTFSTVRNITIPGAVTTTPAYNYSALASHNGQVSVTTDDKNVYLATGNFIIKVDPAGVATLHAGDASSGYVDGPKLTARFNGITAIDSDAKGNIFVADNGNHRIRKISRSGNVTTLAGNGTAGFADGPGASAQFNNVQGLVVYKCGLYVADRDNNRIRRITIPR